MIKRFAATVTVMVGIVIASPAGQALAGTTWN